jgi:hypothetical protein
MKKNSLSIVQNTILQKVAAGSILGKNIRGKAVLVGDGWRESVARPTFKKLLASGYIREGSYVDYLTQYPLTESGEKYVSEIST